MCDTWLHFSLDEITTFCGSAFFTQCVRTSFTLNERSWIPKTQRQLHSSVIHGNPCLARWSWYYFDYISTPAYRGCKCDSKIECIRVRFPPPRLGRDFLGRITRRVPRRTATRHTCIYVYSEYKWVCVCMLNVCESTTVRGARRHDLTRPLAVENCRRSATSSSCLECDSLARRMWAAGELGEGSSSIRETAYLCV